VKVSTEPTGNVEGDMTKYTLLLIDFKVVLTGVIETAVKFKELSLTDQRTIGMDLSIVISGYTTLPNTCKLWPGFITPFDALEDDDTMGAFADTTVIVTVEDDFRLPVVS
jgi:hypothetical protein